MRYINAKWKEAQRLEIYRIYVSDTLYYQGQNKVLNVRYFDLLNPPKEETRSGDEIALEVINRIGLKINECI